MNSVRFKASKASLRFVRGILIASKGREQGMSDRPIDSQGILNMGMPRTTTRVKTEFSKNERCKLKIEMK